ncbi:MAG: YcxB family protein [Bacteroidota bacterium]
MEIEYYYDENDLLTYQLYVASKSEIINKRRQKTKIHIPIINFVFGLTFLITGHWIFSITLIAIAILWYFLIPLRDKRNIARSYKNWNKKNAKDKFGINNILEFNNDFILTKYNGNESKVLTKEIDKIDEISTNIFIKLKSGQVYILPKDKINDINLLISYLKELAIYLNIKYNIEENWEWK